MLSRETEIIESFASIEMSPMLSPNVNLGQSYPQVDQQVGSKCCGGANCVWRGLFLTAIVRDQLISKKSCWIQLLDSGVVLLLYKSCNVFNLKIGKPIFSKYRGRQIRV